VTVTSRSGIGNADRPRARLPYPDRVERVPGAPDLRLGETLGPYRLESVLGEGAVGVVFAAVADDDTVVALKVLKRVLSDNDVYRQRFALQDHDWRPADLEAEFFGVFAQNQVQQIIHAIHAGHIP